MNAKASISKPKRLAERLWEYEPTAVLWEPDGSLRAYKGKALRSAMAAAQADDRAPIVFYDAFRAPDNKRVIAIQAIEDESHPRALKFYCNGGLRTCQEIVRDPDSCILAIQQIHTDNLPSETPLRMKVEANGHSAEIDVPPHPFADWRKVALTQVVIQKDYPMEWIRDHALLYHRAHGYERMVVYDNGSSNIADLKNCLAQLDEGLQVLLIRWPFPKARPRFWWHHPADKDDTCTQVAAINHHLHLVASRSTYVSHFDLDEYLLNRSGKPLVDYLSGKLKAYEFPIWTERVACVTRRAHSNPIRAASFKWQSRSGDKRFETRLLYKMIYPAKPLLAKNYCVLLHPGIVPKRESNRTAVEERSFFRCLIRHTLLKLRLWDSFVSCCVFMHEQVWKFQRSRAKPDLILFHYDGIRTNWGDFVAPITKHLRKNSAGGACLGIPCDTNVMMRCRNC